MSTILITGANGALTQKLITCFLEESDFNVITSSRNVDKIVSKNPNVLYVNNEELLAADILNTVDFVINSAFPRTQETEVMLGAMDFLEKLICKSMASGVKGFVNISSQSVYGTFREVPSREDDLTVAETEYARVKILCEEMGKNLTANSEMSFTNMRLASLIGVEYPERMINKMAKFAVLNHTINVQHSKNIFSYMDIDDAADGLVNFIKNSNPQEWKPVYNFGVKPNKEENSAFIANEIYNLCKEYGVETDLNILSEDANLLQFMDSSNFYDDACWTPKIPLRKSIRKIFEDIMRV